MAGSYRSGGGGPIGGPTGESLASEGIRQRTDLGGEDFDDPPVTHLSQEFKRKHKKDLFLLVSAVRPAIDPLVEPDGRLFCGAWRRRLLAQVRVERPLERADASFSQLGGAGGSGARSYRCGATARCDGAGRRGGATVRGEGAGRRRGATGRGDVAGRRGGTKGRDEGAGRRGGTKERDPIGKRSKTTGERNVLIFDLIEEGIFEVKLTTNDSHQDLRVVREQDDPIGRPSGRR